MTSKGLELKFEEKMSEPKTLHVEEPEINEPKDKDEPSEFVLDDWD